MSAVHSAHVSEARHLDTALLLERLSGPSSTDVRHLANLGQDQ